jgi:predicted methyltransferase
MTENNQNDDNETEKEFYENVAKVANSVNQRLHGSIAPGGTNDTVEDVAEEGESATNDQTDLDQENNYFPL